MLLTFQKSNQDQWIKVNLDFWTILDEQFKLCSINGERYSTVEVLKVFLVKYFVNYNYTRQH
jgi:hypothetical protein